MKLFVWDFHGVLEKDNDLAVLDISNSVLALHGYRERFSPEENKAYYGLKWYEYFERLLPNLSNKEHMALQAACFKFAEDNLDILEKHIKPNDHAITVLRAISEAKHDQILLSNTRPHDLLWFVKTVGIEAYLPESKIFGVNAHQQHGSKKEALKHYLTDKNYDTIIIIGDSASDMELKSASNGVTYFYSHPHIKLNKIVKADYVITDLRKLLQEV